MGSLSQVASASLAWVSDPTQFRIPRPCFWLCQFVFKGNQMRILWSSRLSPRVSPCNFQGLKGSSVIHKSGPSGLDSGLKGANLAYSKSSSSNACWHCLWEISWTTWGQGYPTSMLSKWAEQIWGPPETRQSSPFLYLAKWVLGNQLYCFKLIVLRGESFVFLEEELDRDSSGQLEDLRYLPLPSLSFQSHLRFQWVIGTVKYQLEPC